MERRIQFTFLLLILTQAAHSIEEYVFRLHEVWAPARFVSSLLSNDLNTGFIIFNATLVLFGLACYAGAVRPGRRWARLWVWVWIIIELGNGIGHTAVSLWRNAYFPGLITAPLLMLLSAVLAVQVTQFQRQKRRDA